MTDNIRNMGDGPIEPEYQDTMRKIARTLDDIFNGDTARTPLAKVGFALMVFPLGEKEGRTNYISNVRADDVERLLIDQLARFKERRESSDVGHV